MCAPPRVLWRTWEVHLVRHRTRGVWEWSDDGWVPPARWHDFASGQKGLGVLLPYRWRVGEFGRPACRALCQPRLLGATGTGGAWGVVGVPFCKLGV